MLFLNLPVTDVAKTRAFFGGIGFTFNEQFSDDETASMVLSDQAIVMFLSHAKFQGFLASGFEAATGQIEVLAAVSAESRDEVDRVCDAALASGGTSWREPEDHGYMYGRSFRDPDGHVWEVVWMDPSAIEG
ncbi:hypothetical protein Rrhod_1867 [Rhodococcus rhodnii LMG 5362]|uniref:VOC domain-containing protein n=2 Tax=Rhodococcus rhodnii TaxID=38312 RepID=R7WN80_9NOCA|nr:hypothetical protein Rrhod_1867 [Rhodococcus rhodnii LMG 5362]